ncbi:unnamed protein product [Dibothriocephalus latus]|uniref:Uncharacterized protein n=1 Tax=Dibothriocephalus latus TaxID=60516 RepID=A0A3P7NLZ6_DIBLA|nr:unnamed protein product [Dibothriocephalus latus]
MSANHHPSPPDVLKVGPTRPCHEGDQSFNIIGRSMHPTDAPECTKTTVAGFEYLDPDERPIRGLQSSGAIGLSGLSPFSDDGNLRWSLESQKQSEPDREDKVISTVFFLLKYTIEAIGLQ